jgi:alpha-1,6-mannosyltransferase
VKITPAWRVYALGATLLVALTVCSRNFDDRGGPRFMAALTVTGIAYLLAVRELFATKQYARRVVIVGLVLAAIWQIEFLRIPPGIDDDIHRYVWDGRLQRLGHNPYLVIPSDPAVQALHTAETRNLNNPNLPSPYPPGAQLFFRAVTAIHESVFALKVAFLICNLLIVLLLLDTLRRSDKGAHLVLVFAWNPLLAIEVAGSGHIDIVGALLVLASAAALTRRWRATAALALGFAVAIKFLPLVLLPLYWKRVRIRDAVLAVMVVGLLYVPFLDHGRIPVGSLGTYVQSFRFNGPVFASLDQVLPPLLLAALAVVVGLLTATWLRGAEPEWTPQLFAWPMAAALLCAPVIFPWYLLWLLPFLGTASTLLIVVWTVSIIPTYIMWHLRAQGRPWGSLPLWVMLLEYGCLAITAALIALRRTSESGRPTMRIRSVD